MKWQKEWSELDCDQEDCIICSTEKNKKGTHVGPGMSFMKLTVLHVRNKPERKKKKKKERKILYSEGAV